MYGCACAMRVAFLPFSGGVIGEAAGGVAAFASDYQFENTLDTKKIKATYLLRMDWGLQ